MPTNAASLHKAAEKKLAKLAEVDEKLRKIELEKDRKISEIKSTYAPRIDPLTDERQALVEEIAELAATNEAFFEGNEKTAVFRSGTVSLRTSAGSLEIKDADAAINKLRKLGMLRRFTRIGKRTIDKLALKKHPEVFNKLPGVHYMRDEIVSIKIERTQAELKKTLSPYKTRV